MLRAALVAGLAMAAVHFAGVAHAGESPTAFILGQNSVERGATGNRPHLLGFRWHKGRKHAVWAPPESGRQRMSLFVASNDAGKWDMPQTDLVREAARWIGSGNFTGKPGAWCAWAISAWLTATGHRPLASGMAASALSYGPRLSAPRVGALAVLSTRRGWAGHVGLVAGIHGDLIEMISGNWGHRVSRALVPMRSFVAFIGV